MIIQYYKNGFFIKVLLWSFALTLIFFPLRAFAGFSSTNYISDSTLINKNTMTANQINDFLKEKGSFFADYIIPENVQVPYPTADELKYVTARQFNDVTNQSLFGKTVAELIYDESQDHGINPQVILATLEKESSAVTMSKDQFASKPNRIAWPMFYMYDETMGECLNNGTNCNHESYFQDVAKGFGGVGQQIAYSTAYLSNKYNEYKGTGRCLKRPGESSCYAYEPYNQPITIDGQTLTMQTIASRILYLYTPHIAGAQSFYNIFASWWGDPSSSNPTVPDTISSAPTAPQPGNDTGQYFMKTYHTKIPVRGGKLTNVKAYLNDTVIGELNTDSWYVEFEPGFGTNAYTIKYIDQAGKTVGEKQIQIIRERVGDINGDSRIDLLDLSTIATYWGKSNPEEPLANLNPETDNEVNILDLSILASCWTG